MKMTHNIFGVCACVFLCGGGGRAKFKMNSSMAKKSCASMLLEGISGSYSAFSSILDLTAPWRMYAKLI